MTELYKSPLPSYLNYDAPTAQSFMNTANPWGSSSPSDLTSVNLLPKTENGGFLESMFNLDAIKGIGGGGIGSAGGAAPPGNMNWGTTAIGLVQGLGNAYLGMKQYGLAKDALKTNKEQFARNFGAQAKTTNASLEDRQRARVASNAGAYQSVGDYMNQNRIV